MTVAREGLNLDSQDSWIYRIKRDLKTGCGKNRYSFHNTKGLLSSILLNKKNILDFLSLFT